MAEKLEEKQVKMLLSSEFLFVPLGHVKEKNKR